MVSSVRTEKQNEQKHFMSNKNYENTSASILHNGKSHSSYITKFERKTMDFQIKALVSEKKNLNCLF